MSEGCGRGTQYTVHQCVNKEISTYLRKGSLSETVESGPAGRATGTPCAPRLCRPTKATSILLIVSLRSLFRQIIFCLAPGQVV